MPTIKQRIHATVYHAEHAIETAAQPFITGVRWFGKSWTTFNEQKAVTSVMLSSLDILSRTVSKTSTVGAVAMGAIAIGSGIKKGQTVAQLYVKVAEWLTPSERAKHKETVLKLISSISLTIAATSDHCIVLFDLALFAAKQVGNTQILGGVLQSQVLGYGLRTVLVFIKDKTALLGFGITVVDAVFIGKSSLLKYGLARFRDGDTNAWNRLNMNKAMFGLAANVAKCAIIIIAGPQVALGIAVAILVGNVVVYARCLHSIHEKEKQEKLDARNRIENNHYQAALSRLTSRGTEDSTVQALLPLIRVKVEQTGRLSKAELTQLLDDALAAPTHHDVFNRLGDLVATLKAA